MPPTAPRTFGEAELLDDEADTNPSWPQPADFVGHGAPAALVRDALGTAALCVAFLRGLQAGGVTPHAQVLLANTFLRGLVTDLEPGEASAEDDELADMADMATAPENYAEAPGD